MGSLAPGGRASLWQEDAQWTLGPAGAKLGRASFHKEGEEFPPWKQPSPSWLGARLIIHGPDVINESQEFGSRMLEGNPKKQTTVFLSNPSLNFIKGTLRIR